MRARGRGQLRDIPPRRPEPACWLQSAWDGGRGSQVVAQVPPSLYGEGLTPSWGQTPLRSQSWEEGTAHVVHW